MSISFISSAENGSEHIDNGLVNVTGLCWRVGGGRKAESVWVTEAHDLAEWPKSAGAGYLQRNLSQGLTGQIHVLEMSGKKQGRARLGVGGA